jgi:capsular exopolysaccharide synthesis family protein
VGLRDLVRILGQRKVWIACAVFAGGLTGYFAGSVLPPSYRADGLLVVDTQRLNIPELRTVTSEGTVEPWGARSEARVLTSRENVERAVLALERDPQVFGLAGEPLADRLLAGAWLPDGLRQATANLLPAQNGEGAARPPSRAEIVDAIRRDLMAESEERSYAIALSYRGRDPNIAAAVVNAVMNAYVVHEVEVKEAATRLASERLKDRLDKLWTEWQKSNEAIRAMERDDGLVETNEGTITSQAMAALTLERLRVGTERASAVADRAQITAALEDRSLNVINTELVSPRLRGLWEQETTLRGRLAELGAELGDRHPRIITVNSELADIEAKMVAELGNIRASLDQRIATLEQRDRELGEALAKADKEASTTAAGRARLHQLEREAELKRDLYAQYRGRYEQTVAALNMNAADIRIASRAVSPARPSSPGPRLLGAMGAAFGLLLSCSVIVSRRWLHNRFETLNELSEATGVPALGTIPQTSSFLAPHRTLSQLVARQPDSWAAESMRGILLRIQHLGGDGRVPNVLLVTSPNPSDGKTSFVVTMARIAARDGLRCLAIDCDFRRSALAAAVEATPRQWLSDFLLNTAGSCSPAGLITSEALSDAHYILTRPVRPMSRRVLESPVLRTLIEHARKHWDLVLIDTPPIMNVADPMILAPLADAFVMVVSSRGSDRTTVLEAIHRAEITGRPLAGLVMSRVGNDVNATYSYAGYPSSD